MNTSTMPLRHWIDPRRPITYGIVQAGEHVDDGVPYIRPVDMTDSNGVTDPSDLQRTSPEIARSYSRSTVHPGDLVFSIGPSFGKVMVVPQILDGANLTQGTARLAPGDRIEGRWLFWALQSKSAVEFWESSIGGATFRALNLGPLGQTPISVPPLDEQRRIAAFLDDQVARIDGAISLSHSQRELLTTRDLALLDGLLGRHGLRLPDKIDGDWKGGLPGGWRVIHLSQVLKQLTNGYVGPTRDILQDDGIRYIQSVHIKNGSIDFDRRPFYVSNQWHRERPRINLRAEDVLIVQTGAIGQVAVVPSDFGPASCHALLIARVQPSIVSGRYLAAYLRSPVGFQSLLSRATGALHPHLEGGIKNVNVIVPPLDVQDNILLQLDELRRANGVVIRGLERRTVLLQERKRSLITAAVTGEFDVSSASSRALAGVAS